MTWAAGLWRQVKVLLMGGKSIAEIVTNMGLSKGEVVKLLEDTKRPSTMRNRSTHRLAITPTTSAVFCRLRLLEEFVSENHEAVQRMLGERHASLPLMDRVLLLLAPAMEHDVVKYHGGQGPDLASMLEDHQLDHLDRDLAAELKVRVLGTR